MNRRDAEQLKNRVNRYYRNVIRKINRYWPDPDKPPREEVTYEEMGLCMARMLHGSIRSGDSEQAIKKLWDKITKVLSAEELEIVSMHTQGQSFTEIAKHLGTYKVKVFRRYNRIIKKLVDNVGEE